MAKRFATDNDRTRKSLPPRLHVVLRRRGQRWAFRWELGAEHVLIDRVSELAAAPDVPLDWFDAAVVCHHIARQSRCAVAADLPPPNEDA